jgi:acetyltransferase-like isoleucine patch superfamily enzyme
MKAFFETLIRLRNPDFKLDENIGSSDICSILINKFIEQMRTIRLFVFFKNGLFVFLGKNVTFYGIRNISIGKWTQIGCCTKLSAYGNNSTLIIKKNVTIGSFSNYTVSSSMHDLGKHIVIGNNVGIGDFSHIGGGGGVEIGDSTIIGSYFSCHPSNHIFHNPGNEIKKQGLEKNGIVIGKNCWIGAKVTVLDGVIIGDNCVIGAGAVVTKSFPDNSIIVGIPAKMVGSVSSKTSNEKKR